MTSINRSVPEKGQESSEKSTPVVLSSEQEALGRSTNSLLIELLEKQDKIIKLLTKIYNPI
jgi:hypothetical protein